MKKISNVVALLFPEIAASLLPDTHYGSIWVRHTESECPASSIAKLFSDRVDSISFMVSDTRQNGWQAVLVKAPYISRGEIRDFLKKAPSTKLVMSRSYQSPPCTVLGLLIKDEPLNQISQAGTPFIKLQSYLATPDHEEFEIIAYPEKALLQLTDDLSKFGKAYIRKSAPYKEYIQSRRRQFPSNKILSTEEANIFRTAYDAGYFDYPKRSQIADVAKTLGISKSALSIKLRKVSERLCEAYFEKYVE